MKGGALIFLLVALLSGSADSAVWPNNQRNLTITIAGKVRGIMGRASPQQELKYRYEGVSFLRPPGGGIKTSYTIPFGQPPDLTPAALADPFKVVGAVGYFTQKGDRAAITKLIEPTANSKLLRELNDAKVIASDTRNYDGATGLDILFGFKAEGRFVVVYLIKNPARPILQVDELLQENGRYFLRVQEPDQFEYAVTNIFTAYFAELHGEPGSVTVATP